MSMKPSTFQSTRLTGSDVIASSAGSEALIFSKSCRHLANKPLAVGSVDACTGRSQGRWCKGAEFGPGENGENGEELFEK